MTSIDQTTAAWWAHPRLESAKPKDSEAPVAFAATVAFSLILLISPQNWIPVLRPFRIAFLAAGAGGAALVWERWKHGRPLGLSREIVMCLLLITWAFVTLPLSLWPGGSLATLTELYSKAVIVCWLVANVVTTSERFRFLAVLLMVCTIVLAGTGVKNFLTGTFLTTDDPMGRIAGYQGTLSGNPNDLALMLNLLMPLGIALLLSAKTVWRRVFWLAVICINVFGVVVTFSRGGFLALATLATIYVGRLLRRPGSDRKWAILFLTLAILAIPLVPASYVERLATVTDIESDPTNSAQSRWRDIVAAAQFVTEHPIVGAGIGMDMLALNQIRGEHWTQVHNVYFQYAVDLGVIGGVLYLFILFSVLHGITRTCRSLETQPERRELFLFAEALRVSVIVFAVAAVFHPVAYHFYFYYIAGLTLALRSIASCLGTR